MPRNRNLIPSIQISLMLPEDVKAKLDLFLYSAAEQRLPQGARQEFFVERIREFFSWRRLDLETYGFPPGFFVKGPKAMIEHLEYKLKLYITDGPDKELKGY